MGEESEPLTTEAELRRSNRGILVVMVGVVLIAAVVAELLYGASAARRGQ
jgi:hypothetical protein